MSVAGGDLVRTGTAVLEPGPAGLWQGPDVVVRRRGGVPRMAGHRRDGVLTVEHSLRAEDLCDDLATTVMADLGAPGLLRGQGDFEAVFTGLIRSTVDGPLASWLTFYCNSVARLESGVAGFSPVHQRAADLVTGRRVLDLGSCFGFLPLRLSAAGLEVLATDLSAAAMTLLSRMSLLLGRPIRTLACDAGRVPMPDSCVDTVTAVHLLEHLAAPAGEAVVDEALRLAGRRVVVAVPFEDEPTACYGHVRRFGPADLDRLAARVECRHPGVQATVGEHHGGWLVLDRSGPT